MLEDPIKSSVESAAVASDLLEKALPSLMRVSHSVSDVDDDERWNCSGCMSGDGEECDFHQRQRSSEALPEEQTLEMSDVCKHCGSTRLEHRGLPDHLFGICIGNGRGPHYFEKRTNEAKASRVTTAEEDSATTGEWGV